MSSTATKSTNTTSPSQSPIHITDSARDKINSLMKREKSSTDFALRVSVVGGGCSGFSYKMGFESEPSEGDTIFESNQIKIFLDAKSCLFLEGLTVDYEDGLNGSGFQYKNPKASKSCGCGTSFAV